MILQQNTGGVLCNTAIMSPSPIGIQVLTTAVLFRSCHYGIKERFVTRRLETITLIASIHPTHLFRSPVAGAANLAEKPRLPSPPAASSSFSGTITDQPGHITHPPSFLLRSIRCLRNIIHWNLITTFILRNVMWFLLQLIDHNIHESNEVSVARWLRCV